MASSITLENVQENQTNDFKITQEELFAFHNIDRQYFSRLVFRSKRNTNRAMLVVAFWLWLERLHSTQYVGVLLALEDTKFDNIYEETLLCLRVAESDELIVFPPNCEVVTPLMQSIMGAKGEGINLKFFKENRVNVLNGVANIVRTTCLSVFDDLIQLANNSRDIQVDSNNYKNSYYENSPSSYVSRSSEVDQSNIVRGNVPSVVINKNNDPRIDVVCGGGPSVGVINGGSGSNIGVITGGRLCRPNVGVIGDRRCNLGVIGDRRKPNVGVIGDRRRPSVGVNNTSGTSVGGGDDFSVGVFNGVNGPRVGVGRGEVNVIAGNSGANVVNGGGVNSQSQNQNQNWTNERNPNFNLVPQPPLSIANNLNAREQEIYIYYPSNLMIGDFDLPFKNHHFNNFYQGSVGATSSYNVPMPPPMMGVHNPYGVDVQSQLFQDGLVDEFIAKMTMDDMYAYNGVEQRNLPSSERTIFLTFSKGYPIFYEELRDFLNSVFGDIIEELTMQEVGENEQPLYAKLVVRNAIAMEAVLSEQGKTKFSINGKHVWARKFINRQNSNDDNYPN